MVDGQEVKRVKLVKYLGLIVDEKLVWDRYIDYISSKIICGIGILQHIRHFIPRDSLLLLYHTLIEPYFRYCSYVWGQCGETLKDKLQTLQNRAAQTTAKLRYDEANHFELLTEFGWLSIRNLISLDTAIFVDKEINNLHPEQADSPFQWLDCYSYSTRSVSNNNIFIPRGKTSNFQKTMTFAGSRIWNEIPKEIRMEQALHSFKEYLKKHLIEQQAQSSCLTDLLSLRRCEVAPNRDGWGCFLTDRVLDFPDSLVICVDAFFWGPWIVAGVCGYFWLALLLACLALWTFCWWAL